jgi:hypothetical protein
VGNTDIREVSEASSIQVRIAQLRGVLRTDVREPAMSRHRAHRARYVRLFQRFAAGTFAAHLPSPGLFSLVSKANMAGFLFSEIVYPSGKRA